jgi:hypothetical protein
VRWLPVGTGGLFDSLPDVCVVAVDGPAALVLEEPPPDDDSAPSPGDPLCGLEPGFTTPDALAWFGDRFAGWLPPASADVVVAA